MKKTNQPKINLAQAIAGYMLNIHGRRLSPNTIRDYQNTLRKFQDHIGNPLIADLTQADISAFLAAQPVSNKTALNYHTTLSSLWKWLHDQNLVPANIVQAVQRPRPEKRVIKPLEEAEIRLLLSNLERSRPYARRGKRTSDHTLPHIDRNRAILLFLLDNGVRVSELSNIKIRDLDTKNNRCFILGKGSKERFVPYCARTGQAIWRYLTLRGPYTPDDYLFVTTDNHQMTRDRIERMLRSLGNRAGITGVHPHRFRHTFAISYIRAGGDIFTLQMILGHSTLDMVRHYAQLANIDVTRAHLHASPVEFWRL